jgi:SAM-dependent methyltransferase
MTEKEKQEQEQDQEKEKRMQAYSQAVKSGLYAKKTGLVGKYDNVRRYWEDEITRHFLYPHLKKLIGRCQQQMKRLRVLDLGCGSADGYELLVGIRERDASLEETEVSLLQKEILGVYKGLDLSDDLLMQARGIFKDNPKIVFERHDFTKGLKLKKGEKPYDLYFSSYGTTSHHNDLQTLERMLCDIVEQTDPYSVVMCDWLGRYSYEWQSLWTNDLKERENMDYVVSYIYDEEEREKRRDQLQHLYLRLISRGEVEQVIRNVSRKTGQEIKPLTFFDRSIFVGRHMDTREYNPHAQKTRFAVNSLHEMNMRTDLNSLIIDYVPKEGFGFLNAHFDHLTSCWNTLVKYVSDAIVSYEPERQVFGRKLPPVPPSFPEPLQKRMRRMSRIIEGVGWLDIGLPRENIIEPQLGYALRNLMMDLQKGMGCAHGFCGIFEIDKTGK